MKESSNYVQMVQDLFDKKEFTFKMNGRSLTARFEDRSIRYFEGETYLGGADARSNLDTFATVRDDIREAIKSQINLNVVNNK